MVIQGCVGFSRYRNPRVLNSVHTDSLPLGMVYVNPDTKYNKLFKDFMKKKHFAAVDAWGADESHVKDTFDQLEKFVASNVPEK